MTRMTTDVDALSTFLQTGLAQAVVSLLTLGGVAVALLVTDPELAMVALAVLPVLVAATLWFRALLVARLRRGPRAGRPSSTRTCRRTCRACVSPRRSPASSAAPRVRRPQPGLPRLPAARPALHRDVLPVRRAAVRPRDGRGARRRRGAGRGRHADPGRAHGVPALPRAVLRPGPAALPGLRRLPAGADRAAAHRRAACARPPRSPTTAPGVLGGCAATWSCATSASPTPARTPPALAGVSLRVAAGETVALVGATGAGKSTLVKLLARFYDAGSGDVLVDGVDVRHYRLADYRRRLGVVPQEPHLFTGDVADNIAYGRPDASPRRSRRRRGPSARWTRARATRGVPPPGRRARAGPVRGSAPARRAGPGRARRAGPAAVRRGHRRARSRDRGRRARRRRPADVPADGVRRRAPARHRGSSRPDRRVARRAIVEEGSPAALLAAGGRFAALWRAGELEPAEDEAVAEVRTA